MTTEQADHHTHIAVGGPLDSRQRLVHAGTDGDTTARLRLTLDGYRAIHMHQISDAHADRTWWAYADIGVQVIRDTWIVTHHLSIAAVRLGLRTRFEDMRHAYVVALGYARMPGFTPDVITAHESSRHTELVITEYLWKRAT